MKAVVKFKNLPESAYLASAYKRVNNILSKSKITNTEIKEELIKEDAEAKLVSQLKAIQPEITTYFSNGDYEKALTRLSALRDDVDGFFEKVMVNVDDAALQANRIAILRALSAIFSNTADISVLY